MNASHSIEEQLTQLGRELGSQADLPQRVLDEAARRAPATPRPKARRSLRRAGLRLVPLLAASLLVGLGVWWLSHPRTLYARAMAALQRVETVHVSGWMRHVPRQWPLENPPPKPRAEQLRHAIDAWFWTEEDGRPASYMRLGPVIQLQRGGDMREYQQDTKLLFIANRSSKDHVARFSSLAEYLQGLDRPSLKKEELGTRRRDDRTLRGVRISEGNRVEEYWFDEQTDLPARFSRSTQREDQLVREFEMTFSYDEPTPVAVARYEPPETENVRYGRGHSDVQLAWRRHVQDIGLRLQEDPIQGRVALLPRDGKLFASQWTLKTPHGPYWVMPLDHDQHFRLSLKNFINLRAARPDGDRRHGTWRVPEELHDVELPHCDLVYEDGAPWLEWVRAALDQLDLELVEVVEDRTVWIAEHDGRELKPWREVKPPVPYIVEDGVEKRGVVKPGVGYQFRPVTMDGLLYDLNRMFDYGELSARRPLVIDETGLPKPPPFDRKEFENRENYDKTVRQKYLVATDCPWFDGSDESRRLARQWFTEEFGVTFREETRPATVHVVQSRQDHK